MHDLRYAVRSHARTPLVSGVSILALALGIGASTAVFSVVNAVLLRPLPYAEADRVVRVYNHWEATPRASISPAEYFDYLDAAPGLFSHFGVWSTASVNVTGDGNPERVAAAAVTPAVLSALGASPAIGRLFEADEGEAGGAAVVLLSDGLWRRRFGAARGVIGGSLLVNGQAHTVVGVLPERFRLPGDFGMTGGAELYVPLVMDRAVTARGSHYLHGVARLAPGLTHERAQAGLTAVAARFVQAFPDDYPRDMRFGVGLIPIRDDVIGAIRPVLVILLCAVGFVLLIACANVASLMLARADTRRRELAVRAALGAGRGRIARQLLVESLLLAGVGGAAGVLLAAWGTTGLVALQPEGIPRIQEVTVDPLVVAFAAATTLLTAVLFGLAPVLSWRVGSYGALRESGRGTTASGRRQRLRRGLIVAELALALVAARRRRAAAAQLRRPPARGPGLRHRERAHGAALAAGRRVRRGRTATHVFRRAGRARQRAARCVRGRRRHRLAACQLAG